jgi:hypothetical protein
MKFDAQKTGWTAMWSNAARRAIVVADHVADAWTKEYGYMALQRGLSYGEAASLARTHEDIRRSLHEDEAFSEWEARREARWNWEE